MSFNPENGTNPIEPKYETEFYKLISKAQPNDSYEYEKPPKSKPSGDPDEYKNVISHLPGSSEREVAENLLKLGERDWCSEQLELQGVRNEFFTSGEQHSLSALQNQRSTIELYENFNWLAWAVGMRYFDRIGSEKSLPSLNS